MTLRLAPDLPQGFQLMDVKSFHFFELPNILNIVNVKRAKSKTGLTDKTWSLRYTALGHKSS